MMVDSVHSPSLPVDIHLPPVPQRLTYLHSEGFTPQVDSGWLREPRVSLQDHMLESREPVQLVEQFCVPRTELGLIRSISLSVKDGGNSRLTMYVESHKYFF